MKRLIVLMTLIYGLMLSAMDEYVVVTKPYEPSFAARHPKLVQAMVIAGAAGVTTLAAIGFKKLVIDRNKEAEDHLLHSLRSCYDTFAGCGRSIRDSEELLWKFRNFKPGEYVRVDSLMGSLEDSRKCLNGSLCRIGNSMWALQRVERYVGQSIEDDKKTLEPLTILISAGAVVANFIRQPFKRRMIDTLLTDPQYALNGLRSTRQEFDEELSKILLYPLSTPYGEDLSNYNKLVKKIEKVCPLFLLDERSVEHDGKVCELSRSAHPHFRADFEKNAVTVLSEILKKQDETDTPTSLVSFTSDKRFQELVILTKTLAQNPQAKMNIHLINENQAPTVYDLDAIEPITTVHTRDLQMLNWLHRTFPEAQLSLFTHPSVDNYLEYINREKTAADVIMAADIADDSEQEYIRLCGVTLNAKKSSQNLLLAKSPDEQNARLVTITEHPLSQEGLLGNGKYCHVQPCATPSMFSKLLGL